MKLLTYARTLHDLSLLKELGHTEVILEPKELSRFGRLTIEETKALSSRARELGLRVLLDWDILMTESVFEKTLPAVRELIFFADAFRVQDPGAFHWVLTNTNLPFQFIAENGNHNIEALRGWSELAKGRLERIALSIELSKDAIADYVKTLKVPCELLGFGRILLFYTPRPLLTSLTRQALPVNSEFAVLGESEESPHKGFPIVENNHGTFMFHIKEFCLVDYAAELRSLGLSYFRLDLRWGGADFRTVTDLTQEFSKEKFDAFKEIYPQDLMRGFYLVNKTDVLFPKLKNSRLQKREGNYLGEVLEAEKSSHLAIMVKNKRGLKKSDSLKIQHPKGEIFEAKIYSLKNLAMEDVEGVSAGQIAVIQFIGGVWVKSQVFYQS